MERVHPRLFADIDLAVSGLLGLADLMAAAETRLADNVRLHAFAIDEAIGRLRSELGCDCSNAVASARG